MPVITDISYRLQVIGDVRDHCVEQPERPVMIDRSERLQLIENVRNFCVEKLGMTRNSAFTKIVDKEHPCYNIYISPHDSIKKGNYGSGCVQYNSLAEVNFIQTMHKLFPKREPFKNTDIWIQETMASVELKQCTGESIVDTPEFREKICENAQITDTVLRITPAEVISLIIHENVHINAHLNDICMNYNIEEVIADLIAYQGAKIYGKDNPLVLDGIEKRDAREKTFYDWCNNSVSRLNKYYRKNLSEGKEILEYIRSEYIEKFEDYKEEKDKEEISSSFFINNAFFKMYMPYSMHRNSIRRIMKEEKPREYIEKINGHKNIKTIKQLESIIRS